MADIPQFIPSGAAGVDINTLIQKINTQARSNYNLLIPNPETFGQKLRRLSTNNSFSNPALTMFYTYPSAWAQGATYVKGSVVSANSNWYEAITNGVAGASTPTGQDMINGVSDGTVTWIYIGGPTITTSDPNNPTITFITTSPPFTNATLYWQWTVTPWAFQFFGCSGTVTGGSFCQLAGFTRHAATRTLVGGKIGFYTDAPIFAVGWGSGDGAFPIRLSVDNRYTYAGGHQVTAGSTPTYMVVDFSSVGARKTRYITVEPTCPTSVFTGVKTTTADTVWAPSTVDSVRAVWISDSLMSGSAYGPYIGGNTLHARTSALLGWQDPWCFSLGGTGWCADNAGNDYNYLARVPEAITLNPQIFLFFGSTNDESYTAAQIQANVFASINLIRNSGSVAPIVIFGCWSLNGTLPVEVAVLAGITQAADSNTFWIPIGHDVNFPWVTGSWNNSGGPSGGANNQSIYVAGDGIHPSDLGTLYLATRMANAIRNQVLPKLQ